MVAIRGRDAQPHPEREPTDKHSLYLDGGSNASGQGSERQWAGQGVGQGTAEGRGPGEVRRLAPYQLHQADPFTDRCSSGLQRSLAELDIFASSTTKQLDDTYYSVLAKLSSLQSTVSALQELAELSHQLNSSFNTDADELVTDISSQLDAFGQFEDQQTRIESLQSRIHAGRDVIRGLSERVDAVSGRIESWERADKEWQEKTRKRLKAGWVVTSAVVFLLLALFVGTQYAPENFEETTTRMATDGFNTLRDAAAARADTFWSSRAAKPPETSIPLKKIESTQGSSLPDVIRAFDEL